MKMDKEIIKTVAVLGTLICFVLIFCVVFGPNGIETKHWSSSIESSGAASESVMSCDINAETLKTNEYYVNITTNANDSDKIILTISMADFQSIGVVDTVLVSTTDNDFLADWGVFVNDTEVTLVSKNPYTQNCEYDNCGIVFKDTSTKRGNVIILNTISVNVG